MDKNSDFTSMTIKDENRDDVDESWLIMSSGNGPGKG
jgi:hypothetical protein